MKIAILGRKKDTVNYENFIKRLPATPLTTLSPGELSHCDALILPGGGDITPAFFGEHNTGSRNIDTELDILQFQALEFCLKRNLPVLGICKGMQLINVAFGGSIIQDMPDASLHRYLNGDQYHPTDIAPDSCLYQLYGSRLTVNSAHHQCIGQLGTDLLPIQWCTHDNCIEGIIHRSRPILGLQWHPERLVSSEVPEYQKPHSHSDSSGYPILQLFASWISTCQASGK